jgi:phospho-N-acetylmuramoyl-pentapeptide-transferase
MGYLTAYFLVSYFMPVIIRKFRRLGITSDFRKGDSESGPYQGATPIMGGVVLIPSVIIAIVLWAWLNVYIVSLLILLTAYGLIGFADDYAKVRNKLKVESGALEKKSYADKADGISGKLRLGLEFGVTLLVMLGMFYVTGHLDARMQIPMIPIKNFLPVLPAWLYLGLAVFIVVGGANAVNLTDGLDSLATVPILTSSLFIAAAAYISGDFEFSSRLKLMFLTNDLKEITVFAVALIGTGIAFLKFNSPPASIYMGDVGSLGLGAAVSGMFVFIKAEFYLPIVGGIFVLAAVSAIVQRVWFKVLLKLKGRDYAEKHRFFYRAPYHHHQQALITYNDSEIKSAYHQLLKKFNLKKISDADKYMKPHEVNNKVIWHNHIKAIWFLVFALIIYFKVR